MARGVDVTLFASGDSRTARSSRFGRPARLRGGSGSRGEGERVPAHRPRIRARGRVRRDPQQLRLPPADLQRARRDARADDDPRLLVAADPAGLPALQREHRLRRDQRRRPAPEPRLPRDDPPRDRHRRLRARIRRPASTSSSSAGSIPTRGRSRRSRWPSRRGSRSSSRGSSRTSATSRSSWRRGSTATGCATSARSGRASGRSSSAAPARCCT